MLCSNLIENNISYLQFVKVGKLILQLVSKFVIHLPLVDTISAAVC